MLLDPTARPRVSAPVLLRGGAALQVGLDPPAAVLFEVTDAPGLARVLRQVDGTRTVAELEELARSTLGVAPEVGWLGALLERLSRHALVVEGPVRGTGSRRDGRVRLVGAGPVAVRIADLLAAAGVGSLVLSDDGPVTGVDALAVTRAQALQRRLGRRRPGTDVSVVGHWSKPDAGVDLTVIVAETLECDRGLTDGLLRADQPHLVVRPAERGVVVGPAVRPGKTACLHCLDLTRTDLDPGWPELLPQLVRRHRQPGVAAQAWAAATAVTHGLALLGADPVGATGRSDSHLLDPPGPASLGATLELSEDDHLIRTRRWQAHPRCGCHWGQAAEWGP